MIQSVIIMSLPGSYSYWGPEMGRGMRTQESIAHK